MNSAGEAYVLNEEGAHVIEGCLEGTVVDFVSAVLPGRTSAIKTGR
jgi:hypothetical protein